jgi:hypothetical protein
MWYFIIGTAWTAWLEWYSTKHLEGYLGSPWVMRERLFHLLFWPLSLSVFIKNLFQ